MKMILSLLLLLPSLTLAKDVPASPATYVYNDGVLTAGGATVVSKSLSEFEKKTGHQMVVAAFKGLDGANLEDYSNKVFKAWKVGDKKKNDGILFAMFVADRKWRVEVGYGFEGKLTDIQASNIATAAAVPSFKKGDYDGGVQAVIASLQGELTKTTAGEKVSISAPVATMAATAAIATPVLAAPQDEFPWGWVIVILVVLIILFAIYMTSSDGGGFGSFGSMGGGSSDGDSGGSSSGGFSGGGGSSGGGGASGGW